MISERVIEAAHKAWREQAAQEGTIFEYNLRAALEAAAPHMLAEGWDQGYLAGLASMEFYAATPNPYRSHS